MKKIILLSLVLSFAASAGVFKITNRTGSCSSTSACDLLETEINKNLPDADASTYLPGMANAAASSMKGLGNDYSNDLDFMMVSANVGVGVDTGSKDFSDFLSGDADSNQVRGVGINAALTVGLDLGILPVDKLGPIDLEKMDLFISAMKLERGEEGVDDTYANITYFGVKARYHLMEGTSILPGGLLKWGGLHVTTGIERTSLKMALLETFNESQTNGGATATFSGTAKVGAEVDVTSIPIEVSTYVQTLYALTFYGGMGVDFNFGDAKSIAQVNGNVDITGVAGTGDGTLDLGSSGDPDGTSVRGFFGLQIGVPLVKFYVQLNKRFTGDDGGQAAAGLKVIW